MDTTGTNGLSSRAVHGDVSYLSTDLVTTTRTEWNLMKAMSEHKKGASANHFGSTHLFDGDNLLARSKIEGMISKTDVPMPGSRDQHTSVPEIEPLSESQNFAILSPFAITLIGSNRFRASASPALAPKAAGRG